MSGAQLAEERGMLARWAAKVNCPLCPKALAAYGPSQGRRFHADVFVRDDVA